MMVRITRLFHALTIIAGLGCSAASAQDSIKLAIGQRGNWDTSVSEIGTRAGIFKKNGLALEMLYTQGSAETLQAVLSGSVDIGVGAGVMGVLGAYSKTRRCASSVRKPRAPAICSGTSRSTRRSRRSRIPTARRWGIPARAPRPTASSPPS